MTSAEFVGWMAYYQLEPWGPTRDDLRSIYMAQSSVAPYTKGGKAPQPRDYFGHLFARLPKQSDEEMELYMRLWTTAKGGTVIEAKKNG